VPVGFLSDAERERLDSFPAQVVPGDIETYFTLSRADRRQIPRTASPANRLGFAIQLGALRFLGFCPDDLTTVPEAVVTFVARQIDVAPGELARYGRRGQTRTEHLRQIRRYLGFRKTAAGDLARLETWLLDRACHGSTGRSRRHRAGGHEARMGRPVPRRRLGGRALKW
jgi:TnpA family transposase